MNTIQMDDTLHSIEEMVGMVRELKVEGNEGYGRKV